jgi:hypothetical protein
VNREPEFMFKRNRRPGVQFNRSAPPRFAADAHSAPCIKGGCRGAAPSERFSSWRNIAIAAPGALSGSVTRVNLSAFLVKSLRPSGESVAAALNLNSLDLTGAVVARLSTRVDIPAGN